MVGSETTQEQVNVLQTANERISLKGIYNQLYESKDIILEAGLYGCIGFFTGYLLKRYSAVIALLILFIAGLFVLNQLELISITVNTNTIYEFFDIQPALVATDNVAGFIWEWIRANALIVTSAVIGFLIGLRIG